MHLQETILALGWLKKLRRKLTQALQQLQSDDQITQMNIGILEGMIPIASEFCHQLFEETKLHLIEMDVFDLSELEERFEKDELDLIFTAREPGKHKYTYVRNLGFQAIEKTETDSKLRVMSPFEYTSQAGRKQLKDHKVFISNSLAVRKIWCEQFGGSGSFPSEVQRKKSGDDGEVPVILVASDVMSPAVWKKIEKIKI